MRRRPILNAAPAGSPALRRTVAGVLGALAVSVAAPAPGAAQVDGCGPGVRRPGEPCGQVRRPAVAIVPAARCDTARLPARDSAAAAGACTGPAVRPWRRSKDRGRAGQQVARSRRERPAAVRAPSGVGAIIAVDSARDIAPARRFLVQTRDASGGSTGRVWVGVGARTPVVDARRRRVALGALVPGMPLRAWSQVIKHSDPAQTGADSVVVDRQP
jgi:hypothetical protein